MNINSGILLHMGINYVVAPPPQIDQRRFLAFQTALLDKGIDYGEAKYTERDISLTRTEPSLQVRIVIPEARVGQLLIVAPKSGEGIDLFGMQAEEIVEAFGGTWPDVRQVVASDCTLRYLYQSDQNHAFQEIWEQRLNQSAQLLEVFGAPVSGGGLRLVIAPSPVEANPAEVDLKIESFLQDPSKVFLEVQYKWPQKQPPDSPFDPRARLQEVDRFIDEKVLAFMNQ